MCTAMLFDPAEKAKEAEKAKVDDDKLEKDDSEGQSL
jgi:hypothetical protein